MLYKTMWLIILSSNIYIYNIIHTHMSAYKLAIYTHTTRRDIVGTPKRGTVFDFFDKTLTCRASESPT